MFIGHYGVSYAAKAVNKQIPLWLLFIAVQLVDVAWAILVPLGIEKVRIVPGITATNPLDLYYMPYTHSLVGAALWSLLAYGAYRLWAGQGNARPHRAALIVALAVFSHWLLDLIVHRPDLPLYDDQYKLGLGLWNYPAPGLLLEIALLAGGMWLYLRATRGQGFGARYGMPLLGAVMLATQAIVFFGPPPPNAPALAATALIGYLGFAAAAHWLEKKRR